MEYFHNLTKNLYSHSLDMVVFELFGEYIKWEKFFELHKIDYTTGEVKTSLRHAGYVTYFNFGGIDVTLGNDIGKGQLDKNYYDEQSETWEKGKNDIVTYPKTRIRFNPNKCHKHTWFDCENGFVQLLNAWAENERDNLFILKKYDYAVDVPYPMSMITVKTKKEPQTYKGTRYYGRENNHGHLRIYDKKAERKRFKDYSVLDENLTRIEYTWDLDKPRKYDEIRICEKLNSKEYKKLPDTDKAIIEMFNTLMANNIPYDLKIGRKKMEKLKDYLFSEKQIVSWFDKELIEELQTVIHFTIPNLFYENDALLASGLHVIVEKEEKWTDKFI